MWGGNGNGLRFFVCVGGNEQMQWAGFRPDVKRNRNQAPEGKDIRSSSSSA